MHGIENELKEEKIQRSIVKKEGGKEHTMNNNQPLMLVNYYK